MAKALAPSRRALLAALAACASLYAVFSLAVAARWLDGSDLALHAWAVQNLGPTVLGLPWSAITAVGSATVSTAAVCAAAFFAWRAGAARTAAIIIVVSLAGGLAVDGFKALHGRPYPTGGRYVVVEGNGTACAEGARCDIRPVGNASVYCPPGSRCNFYYANGTHEEEVQSTFIPANLTEFPTRPGRAYPSGHTMGATLSWGAALLLGVRAVQRRRGFDPWAVGAWAAVAFVGGVSRVPVHAHWWTDVVGSWLLAGAFLAAAILADDRWGLRVDGAGRRDEA